jgi:uncharacterized protein YciI
MPYFVFQGIDRAESEALRLRTREDHRVHLRQAFPGCRCVLGGPLTNDSGQMIGTLLVLEAEARDAAAAFVARDPYALNGLFQETRLTRWNWTMGAPEPTASPPERLGDV